MTWDQKNFRFLGMSNAEIQMKIEAQMRLLQSAVVALNRGETKQDIYSCLDFVHIAKDNLTDVREALAEKLRGK